VTEIQYEGKGGTAESAKGGASLLEKIIREGRMARDEAQESHARDIVGEFVNQVLEKRMTVDSDTMVMVEKRIAQIDELISNQLSEILHTPEFQRLEASWRGLHFLVKNTETSGRLKLRVLHVTKKELASDLERTMEFDQSSFFKKIYEDEFGTFGGQPFSVLIGDYEFGRSAADVTLLQKIASVAAASHAPFITAASPQLFDLDRFTDLGQPRDLAQLFESSELAKWRTLRESEDSRYITLTLPRILLRLPYGPDTTPVEEFNFVEDVDGKDHGKYLWGNAAYALGQRINEAFALYGWGACIRGVEGGGVVTGLPSHTFATGSGDHSIKGPVEVAITDRREKELDDLGFMALSLRKGTEVSVFFGSKTINKPKEFDTPEATANALVSSQLPYILAASRFAHYLKAIMRDKVGSFANASSVEAFLNRWIGKYIELNDEAPMVLKAQRPLREAKVQVSDVPGRPGSYRAVVFLRPHFQLNELTASIRLVADLPQSTS
jgi:type VI secretion system protein ImpC